MIPASVPSRLLVARRAWLRAAAAAAILLPAAGLHAQTPGTLDTSFTTGSLGATIYAVDYQIDVDTSVKVTAGGDRAYGEYFLTNGQIQPNTQPSGIPSTDFVLPFFGNAARIIYTIVPERVINPDATLPNTLLGGSFDGGFGRGTNLNRVPQNLIRITPDGLLDTNFATAIGTGANNYVTSIVPLDDGRIVVGGLFTAFNKFPRRRIVRLFNSGQVDPNFATGANIDNDVLAVAESIDPTTGGPDGSTLVGGIFNRVAGQPYAKLARLDPNGNLDLSFHPSIDLRVNTILVQPNGKIVIGGTFTNVNGVRVSRLARLNYDGSFDPTFVGGVSGVPNNDVDPTAVYVLKPVGDGRVYVGGEFAQINAAPRRYLGLISADGVVDNSFVPTPSNVINDSVQSIAIQSDNNILIGETLGPRVNNKYPPSLVRLFGVTPASSPTVPLRTTGE